MNIRMNRDWTATFSIFAGGMFVWIGALGSLAVVG